MKDNGAGVVVDRESRKEREARVLLRGGRYRRTEGGRGYGEVAARALTGAVGVGNEGVCVSAISLLQR